jgi:hypothetical protein
MPLVLGRTGGGGTVPLCGAQLWQPNSCATTCQGSREGWRGGSPNAVVPLCAVQLWQGAAHVTGVLSGCYQQGDGGEGVCHWSWAEQGGGGGSPTVWQGAAPVSPHQQGMWTTV